MRGDTLFNMPDVHVTDVAWTNDQRGLWSRQLERIDTALVEGDSDWEVTVA